MASSAQTLSSLAVALRSMPPTVAETKSQTKKVKNLLALCANGETGKVGILEKLLNGLKKKLKELRDLKEKLENGFTLSGSHRDARIGKLFRDYNKRLKDDVERTLKSGNETARKTFETIQKYKLKHSIASESSQSERKLVGEVNTPSTGSKSSVNTTQDHNVSRLSKNGYASKQLQQELLRKPNNSNEEMLLEEEEALREVEKQSVVIKELAMDVSSLLETQQGDVDRVEENTAIATEKMVDGVIELAIAKKREAGKHIKRGSLISGVTGGVTGLVVAGPVGMIIGGVAGAGLGGAVGGGVTAASRWSIDAEIRSLKTLRAITVEKNGDYMCQVEAYENEVWGSRKHGGRGWKSSVKGESTVRSLNHKGDNRELIRIRDWSNEFGKPLQPGYPHPDAKFADSRSSPKDLLPIILGDDVISLCKDEIDTMQWKWAKGSWYIDIKASNCDLHGWSYAYSKTSTKWYPEMSRSTYVRRRKWVHHIFARKCSSHGSTAQSEAKVADLTRRVPQVQHIHSRLAREHLNNAISTLSESNAITASNAQAVEIQGEQIKRSLKNSFMVGDTSEHANRINRAADISGVIRNIMNGASKRTKQFENDVEKQDKALKSSLERELKDMNDGFNPEDPLDQLSRNCAQQYNTMKAMNSTLDNQNQHLEQLEETVDKNKSSVESLRNKILT